MNEDWRKFTTNSINGNDLLSHFEPVEMNVTGDMKKKLINTHGQTIWDYLTRIDDTVNTGTGVYDSIQKTQQEVKLLIYPSNFFIANYILQWSDLGSNYINTSEPAYWQKSSPDTSRQCELICDKQRNEMLTDTCDCRKETYPPQQVTFGWVGDPRSEKEGPHTTGVNTVNTLGMQVSLPAVKRKMFGLGHYNLEYRNPSNPQWCEMTKVYHEVENELGTDAFNIVFPQGCREDEGWYRINYTESIDRTYVLDAQRTTLVDLSYPDQVAGIKVMLNDVSQTVDQFYQASGPSVLNIYVPGVGFTSIEDHHKF